MEQKTRPQYHPRFISPLLLFSTNRCLLPSSLSLGPGPLPDALAGRGARATARHRTVAGRPADSSPWGAGTGSAITGPGAATIAATIAKASAAATALTRFACAHFYLHSEEGEEKNNFIFEIKTKKSKCIVFRSESWNLTQFRSRSKPPFSHSYIINLKQN